MPSDQSMLRSETVEMIQTRLAELGYYRGEIHGNFDEETVRAVKAFQHDHNLAEDVITNPETWRQIFFLDEQKDGYTFTDILKRELFEISLSRKRRLQFPQRGIAAGTRSGRCPPCSACGPRFLRGRNSKRHLQPWCLAGIRRVEDCCASSITFRQYREGVTSEAGSPP